MSSDENTEDGVSVPKKQKSSTRRGFSKRISVKTDTIAESSAIYTTRVSKCFNSIKSTDFTEEVRLAAADEKDDVDNFPAKSSRQTKTDVVEGTDAALLLSDEEQEVKDSSNEVAVTTVVSPSPPPPPSPPKEATRKKKKRAGKQKKLLMSAAADLSQQVLCARDNLNASEEVLGLEPEVLIVDDGKKITVRVDHMGTIERFKMNLEEPFSGIVSQIAGREGVQETCVMLVHNDQTLRPTDTPVSVNFHRADIIQCHILDKAEDSFNISISGDQLELLVQCQGSKHPKLIKTPRDEPLLGLMQKYAELVGKDVTYLQFWFDGEVVRGGQSAADLDMEEGDILDVRELTVNVIT